MKVLKRKVLLLNQTFEPLAILPVRKVLKKVMKNSPSLQVEEYYDDVFLYAANTREKIKVPSVVRLKKYIHLKKVSKVTVGKKAKIFNRDGYRCIYCDVAGDIKDLTLDHLLPKSRGGDSSPHNLVTSCKACNNKKGDKLPEELGLNISKSLLHSNINLALLVQTAKGIESWRKYLYV